MTDVSEPAVASCPDDEQDTLRGPHDIGRYRWAGIQRDSLYLPGTRRNN